MPEKCKFIIILIFIEFKLKTPEITKNLYYEEKNKQFHFKTSKISFVLVDLLKFII